MRADPIGYLIELEEFKKDPSLELVQAKKDVQRFQQ